MEPHQLENPMKIKIQSDWAIGVSSELKDFGYTMDNEKFIGETFFVFISNDYGVFSHNHRFDGTKQEFDDEGWVYFPDIRKDAKDKALLLADNIMAKGEFDITNWEYRPHYR
jgi:hypothetical protein